MLRQRIWSYATSISAASIGGHTRSRFSVMLSVIIGVNILNWYGAVIAQSGRQFDESGVAFSVAVWYNVEVWTSIRLARINQNLLCLLNRCISV